MDDGKLIRELNYSSSSLWILAISCGECCCWETSPPSTKIVFGKLTVLLVGAGSPISII